MAVATVPSRRNPKKKFYSTVKIFLSLTLGSKRSLRSLPRALATLAYFAYRASGRLRRYARAAGPGRIACFRLGRLDGTVATALMKQCFAT